MTTFYTTEQIDKQAGIIGQRIRKVSTDLTAYVDTKILTVEERDKLAGLESSKYLGTYLTAEAIPTEGATSGNYADVDAGPEATVERWIYDADSEVFVKSFSDIAGETSASVKAKYEENPNTNAFTDAEKTKLSTLVLTENNFTNALKTKLEGLTQTTNTFTPEHQSKLENLVLTENSFTSAEKTKLANLTQVDITAALNIDSFVEILDAAISAPAV